MFEGCWWISMDYPWIICVSVHGYGSGTDWIRIQPKVSRDYPCICLRKAETAVGPAPSVLKLGNISNVALKGGECESVLGDTSALNSNMTQKLGGCVRTVTGKSLSTCWPIPCSTPQLSRPLCSPILVHTPFSILFTILSGLVNGSAWLISADICDITVGSLYITHDIVG